MKFIESLRRGLRELALTMVAFEIHNGIRTYVDGIYKGMGFVDDSQIARLAISVEVL